MTKSQVTFLLWTLYIVVSIVMGVVIARINVRQGTFFRTLAFTIYVLLAIAFALVILLLTGVFN